MKKILTGAVFDSVARLYDETRPSYPEDLIRDVIQISGIPPGGRILEIGCGTGQATLPFAKRGYRMVCLDAGANMAALAAQKLQGFDNVRIVTERFEDWQPDTEGIDLIISATAFHWITPKIAFVKTAAVLHDAGALAVFRNNHARAEEGFFQEAQELYATYASSICRTPEQSREREALKPNTDEGPLFEMLSHKVYPWSEEYDADRYIRLLSTYSDHINLPDVQRESLFDGIRSLIETRYGGTIVKHYEAVLDVWRKRPVAG
jgi:ubiquinone/menaquinone biosynthesis C-methylase UbiE